MPGANAANVCVIPKAVLKYNLQCEDIERGFFSELTRSQRVEPSRIISDIHPPTTVYIMYLLFISVVIATELMDRKSTGCFM